MKEYDSAKLKGTNREDENGNTEKVAMMRDEGWWDPWLIRRQTAQDLLHKGSNARRSVLKSRHIKTTCEWLTAVNMLKSQVSDDSHCP